ncbi:MAG TPA: multicopper oxidase domain-containing protein, partial [Jiangellaceae bacterium]
MVGTLAPEAAPGPSPTAAPGKDSGSRAAELTLAIATVATVLALTIGAMAVVVAGGSTSDDASLSSNGVAGTPAGAETVEVELGEFYVEPASIDVAAGTELTLTITNAGTVPHDLKLEGTTGSDMIDPGETVTASFGVIEATGQAWCTVPGHKAAGMVLDVNVTGAAAASASSTSGTGTDDSAVIDFEAEPEDGWRPYDPALEPAPGGTEHKLTMHAVETELEVAPGVTQMMWTFDGAVPGTTLRGRVGDIFTITLVNDGEIGHSIDFHASKVAWNDEMRTIEPGESLVYQFEARHAGAFMYHCGTQPTLHHIGNGMLGAIIIDPPRLPPVDHEYLFVQSELYLGPQGEPGDLGKMQDEAWDAVVFNGYVNQYLHAPIRVEPGERVRAWVIDDGPSENSSFHVVGTVFDTVFREGAYTLRPDSSRGGAQALDLQPAQGGFVEFTFDEAGLYPIVTHKFANVGKGALGLFQAG